MKSDFELRMEKSQLKHLEVKAQKEALDHLSKVLDHRLKEIGDKLNSINLKLEMIVNIKC